MLEIFKMQFFVLSAFFAVKKQVSLRLYRQQRSHDPAKDIMVLTWFPLAAGKFPDFKFIGPEVDQQTMLQPGGFEITQNLGLMFRGQRFRGL
jgi:hypothetical protein